MVKQYITYKCIKCGKKTYTRPYHGKMEFGNPLFNCKYCGSMNYDIYIYEPVFLPIAALDAYNKEQRNTALILLNFFVGIFLFFGGSLLIGTFIAGFVLLLLILLPLNLLIISKGKKPIDIRNNAFINASANRIMQNPQYANVVATLQKVGNDSAAVQRGICLNCGFENGGNIRICQRCGNETIPDIVRTDEIQKR